jgi:FeS assembly SUF system protein
MEQAAKTLQRPAESQAQMRLSATTALVGKEHAATTRVSTIARDSVISALRTVRDPEIPVNVYDLGLIYRIEVSDEAFVEIDMTLTAPGCPVAGEMLSSVQRAVSVVEGVCEVKVNLVFDPPWDRSKMSEEARLELGLL